MEYPKKMMKISELTKLGYTKGFLMDVYRIPGQRFAMKKNMLKSNSVIMFDTNEFEKWRLKNLVTENKMIAGRW